MPKMDVCTLEPGMVLASDLRDRNGRLLVGKGVELTSRHLKTIKTWGVVEADIEGVSGEDSGEEKAAHMDPAVLEAANTLTKERFIHADLDNEVMRQLFHICVQRKAHDIASGADPGGTHETCDQSTHPDEGPLDERTHTPIDPHELVGSQIQLPSLPIIFKQISEAMNDPRTSATHLANIISKDAGLAARLLKIVNSAFYEFPSKIDTISRAVAIIGTKELSALTLGTCAVDRFQDIPADLIDMNSFWKHSVACGIIARVIASYKDNSITERCFLAGLLHDVGRLIIYKTLPVQAKDSLLRTRRTQNLLYETEQEILGFDHSVIGGMLVREWRLPAALEDSIGHHHTTAECEAPLEPAIVHLSDIITNALGMGTSGEQFVPPLDAKAWEKVGLPSGILNTAVQQADRHIAETVHILFA